MAASRSDALLLFGVTGDLAHKMIFPALYAMVKRGDLKVPIIGVAFPKWSLERLHRRVTWKASLVPDLASSACVKSRRSTAYQFNFYINGFGRRANRRSLRMSILRLQDAGNLLKVWLVLLIASLRSWHSTTELLPLSVKSAI